MQKYIWLVPLLPLIGAAINGLLGRKLRFSEKLIGGIAVGSVALSFLISLTAIYSYGFGGHPEWPKPYLTSQDGFSFNWIPGGAVSINQGGEARREVESQKQREEQLAAMTPEERAQHPGIVTVTSHAPGYSLLNIEWSYQLDPLSSIFMLIVTGVGLCIFVFATGYMHGEAGFYRFFAYMGLFMFAMLVLVMGSNFLMMFVGWEGVGLCSYLLIGYYFDRQEAANASRKAFITNRVGDFGFALAIFGVIATFGTAQYTEVFEQAKSFPIELLGHWGILSWIALGLFVGACGKSAQLPLHVWLPDAMAGPTPVSALIHAATMVTAGLYMVTRTNVIFQHSQTMLLVVALIGAATAIFAATIGITQNDIKKVLAYSTVSQLGFMFMACGVGAFAIGIFHVMTHAFFKALMFLGAGSVIHGMHHEQDMRRMGGLKKYMPYTYWTFMAGWLAICGIIPFSGFWSKDEILWKSASMTYIPLGWLVWLIGTIAATCTAFYMTRLMAMTFWGKERFLEGAGGEADEAHASAYDKGLAAHDAVQPSAGDRPRHEPGEHVGPVHEDVAHHIVTHGHALKDDDHAHGAHLPHESPPSMWVPLAVLAILAVIGGLVGIGPAFRPVTGTEHPGGRLHISTWLNPIIWNPVTREFNPAEGGHEAAPPETAPAEAPAATEGAHGNASGYGDVGFNIAHSVENSTHSELATEWIFIVISLVVAGIGMLLGGLFYVWRPELPNIWAQRLRPLYAASYNKYWVDEFYGLTVTRRTMDAARVVYAFDSKLVDGIVNGLASLSRLLSRIVGGVDKYFVDGLVNTIAAFILRLMSPLFRAAQTGFTQNYALVMVLGLIVAVAAFFGSDIVTAVRAILAAFL
ncbi:MAG TPA: NADH-quinone oxidoreductase subunit L [Pyrinomonadaceae bacterium]|jgi:NADH-quinone oxidoreductase subunit L|nr:NADH-quinone oxidoreductase subunit L [Pyrinomonadaceae bacterium]